MNPNRPIKDIMTTQLIVAHPEDSIDSIRNIFQKHIFHHIPIVETAQNLVGIISKEDYLKVFHFLSLSTTGKTWTEKESANITAKNIMTKLPMYLSPDDSIGLAADIFMANKFHALPVVEDDQLMGIVTTHDLLAYSFKAAVAYSELEDLEE